jgi:hypothetical protein
MPIPDPTAFEKLGVFYLGRGYDLDRGEATEDLLLYDAKDLTTHAVCVGMTGSGKTGLCIALLEEAGIDGIPAIAVDPKGDLGNLMLTFPDLRPEDFRPWVDDGEASRAGMSPEECAKETADTWRAGLAEWGQDGARIARLRQTVDVAIYTPGSTAGVPLTVLKSFAAPGAAVTGDSDALRERVTTTVSGLLALLGIEADPVRSREHILLATLLQRAWQADRDLDLATLIAEVQKPPLDRIGVLDLESFFPQKERAGLAMQINGVLAAPGFAAWLEGEPLDVQRLLWTAEGKPRIAILSIAHLSDAERMFFVTILLNELLAWMRRQAGTPSLRAVLYMDEILGYFPPVANPPSKTPMLTLLKQARAYGLGVVLATQNPVDLDYKGLANAGTWFLGRLQTERDKERVLEGLEGASAAAGAAFDRQKLDRLLAGLRNRVFLMNNVHEDTPVLFQTRWALSYLRGPLTKAQIQSLTARSRPAVPPPAATVAGTAGRAGAGTSARSEHPALPAEAAEGYAHVVRQAPGARLVYQPGLLGVADLHFVMGSVADTWQPGTYLAPLAGDVGAAVWDGAVALERVPELRDQPEAGAGFAAVPAAALNAKSYPTWQKAFASHLYQNATLTIYACPAFKLTGKAGETAADLRIRAREAVREVRDRGLEKVRARYAPKLAALQDRIRRAQERVAREQAQYDAQKFQTALSAGATVLGALLGRKAVSMSTLGRATTAGRGVGRTMREKGDVARAAEEVTTLQQQLGALEEQFRAETTEVSGGIDPETAEITEAVIRPRKSDTAVRRVSLVWLPVWVDAGGNATDAWR